MELEESVGADLEKLLCVSSGLVFLAISSSLQIFELTQLWELSSFCKAVSSHLILKLEDQSANSQKEKLGVTWGRTSTSHNA